VDEENKDEYAELEIPDFLKRKRGEVREAPIEVARTHEPKTPEPKPANTAVEIAALEQRIKYLRDRNRRLEAGPVPEHPHHKFRQDRTLDLNDGLIRSLQKKLDRLKNSAE